MLKLGKFCNVLTMLASVMLIVVIQLCPFSAFAEKIDAEQAANIASRFFSSKFKSGSGNGIKPLSVPGGGALKNSATEDAYYVFTPLSARGFVIVSGDDRLQPIVGYSTDNSFDPENLPDGLAAYLSDYAQVVKAMSEKGIEYKPTTRGGQAVEPLMKVQWNQSEPYDRLTPTYGNDHAPTGCVATAIAQVMKYHNFPPSGHGTVNYKNETVDLGHTYDWDNMLDKYVYYYPDDYQYTDEQAMAVATLMRDVGYAVKMSYGTNASSASSALIAGAMCHNFNYSPDIKYVLRGSYSTQAWVDEIRANLLRGEPVLYGGTDGQYGHQFVCDGIDADDMLHINWGWGGWSDGYFDMNILSPDNLGIGAGNGAYYQEQDMVINIRPGDASADYSDKRFPLAAEKIIVNNTVSPEGKNLDSYLSVGLSIYNSTGADFTRSDYGIALCFYDNSGKCVYISAPSPVSALSQGYYIRNSASVYISSIKESGKLTDGHYTVSVACFKGDFRYSLVEVSPEDIIPLGAGDLNSFGVTIKEGDLYLDNLDLVESGSQRDIRIVDADTSGAFYAGLSSRSSITLTLQNNSTVLENSSYDLLLIPEDEVEEGKLYDCSSNSYIKPYLYPGVRQDISVDINLYKLTSGRYRVFLGKYVWDYENDVSGYKTIACDKPIVIEVQELPTDRIILTTKLDLGVNYFYRRISNYMSAESSYYNPYSRFNATIQLWARPVGGDESQEILLFQSEEFTIRNGSGSFSFDGWGVDGALWLEQLGKYEAYLKYIDSEGNPVLFDCENNHAEFDLLENDDDIRIELASPIVVNGGKPFVPETWTTFEAEFELMSPTGITILPDKYYDMRVSRTIKNSERVSSFWDNDIKFEKTTLAPGEKTKVWVEFWYVEDPENEDIINSTLYVVPTYITASDGYIYPIQVLPYIDNLSFKVDYRASVDAVVADGEAVDVKVEGGRITVSNLPDAASVELYTVAGSKVAHVVSESGSQAVMEGVSPGAYLLRVNAVNVAPIVRKLIVP